METIEVRYTPIPVTGGITYHKYIVYTDANGQQFGARAGSYGNGPLYGWSKPPGFIIVEHGPYNRDFKDFDPTGTDEKETIKTGNDLSGDWRAITRALDDIQRERYPYDSVFRNSNTAVDEALRRAGLPEPVEDGQTGYLSPGSGRDIRLLTPGEIRWRLVSISSGLFFRRFRSSPPRRDPLVFDLDGDGIETTGIGTTIVHFDHDGNGFVEATGWIGADDGLLVLDRNGNGLIDNGKELFGDQTPLIGGGIAGNGFLALAQYDDNGDGEIDVNDSIWTSLKIWNDRDGNGFSWESELFNLSNFNITSISLASSPTNFPDGQGNIQTSIGSIEIADGTTRQLGEYLLDRRLADTVVYDEVPVPEDVAVLPNLGGLGAVYDLHQALARDNNGQLKVLLQAFVAQIEPALRISILEQLLLKWTGNDDIVAGSRGPHMDARKLAVLESFMGERFADSAGTNPGSEAAVLLDEAYCYILEAKYGELIGQTHLSDLYSTITYRYEPARQEFVLDLSQAQAQLRSELNSDAETAKLRLSEFARSLRGLGLQETVNYLSFRESFLQLDPALGPVIDAGGLPVITRRGQGDFPSSNHVLGTNRSEAVLWDYTQGGDGTVNGYSGNDVLYGSPFNNNLIQELGNALLVGLGGNDQLLAGAGDDILDGGAGNDILAGEAGNDTYISRRGDGQDRIVDSDPTPGNTDTLWFGSQLTLADLGIRRVGNDLVISILGSEDSVTVYNHFQLGTAANRVEQFVFQDGTIVSDSDFLSLSLLSTEGNDVIFGASQADTISGLGGNDLIVGLTGDDVLAGNAGNDILYGGSLEPWSVSNYSDLYQRALLDGIVPSATPNGNDTYRFARGDGQDVIVDVDNAPNLDVIEFASGILPSEVTATRVGDDLLLAIAPSSGGMENDSITVRNWFRNETNMWRIEEIRFADGTTWDIPYINQAVLYSAATVGNDVIHGFNNSNDHLIGLAGVDNLYGKAGDDLIEGGDDTDSLFGDSGDDTLRGGQGVDYLYGESGNDILDGGAGDDRLNGGSGNDTYLFGRGGGADRIEDIDTMPGNIDAVVFASDVLPSDVQFTHLGQDLRLTIAGTGDKLDLSSWLFDDSPAYKIEEIRFADGTVWDVPTIKAILLQGTPGNDILIGYSSNDTIDGLAGNDTIYGVDGNDFIIGGAGVDSLYGDEGSDQIYGSEGSDLLVAGNGDDVLDGGAGNDRLYGGHTWSNVYNPISNGNDTYVFGRGQGTDTIIDIDGLAGNHDVISFNSDTLPEDVIVRRSGNDLHLRIVGTDDNLYVTNFFSGPEHRVEEVRFADGTVWDVPTLYARGLIPTPSDDVITGYDTNDTITGLEGADVLRGMEGDDQLDGGLGDDELDGGTGSDVYTYSAGQGNDVIQDTGASTAGLDTVRLNGLIPDDVTLSLAGPDLIVQVNATGEQLTLTGWQSGTNGIEQLVFGDGTVWDEATIRSYPFTGTGDDDYLEGTEGADILDGGAGNDTINGRGGNDRLYGGTGDDYLYAYGNTYFDGGAGNDQISAGQGNDTYLVSNDGFDVIRDDGGANTMLFAPGITLANLSIQAYRAIVSGDGDYEVIQIAVGTGDGTGAYYSSEVYVYTDEVGGYLYGGVPASLQFVFADGTTLTQDEIFAHTDGGVIGYQQGTVGEDLLLGSVVQDDIVGYEGHDRIDGRGGNDSLQGWDGNDIIAGGSGDDSIGGDEGDDVLAGGRGNDYVYGGNGDDVYVFNRGDGQDLIENRADPALPGVETLSFGLGIQPGDIRGHVNVDGFLVLTMGGGDSITIPWFDYYDRSVIMPDAVIERIQFVGTDGTRVFDFAGLVESMSTELLSADALNPVVLFTAATAGYELTGTVAPISEQHVVAYGLTGDLFAIAAQQIGNVDANDVIRGRGGDDTITDLGGDNTIQAGDGNNVVTTGAGNDSIITGSGNDIISAGAGADQISGGAGNDTFYFNLGDGIDLIEDLATPGEGNRVVFGPGISPGDLRLSVAGSMLAIDVGQAGDGLRLSNFDPVNPLGAHAIDTFEFADGSALSYAELLGLGLDQAGTGTDDLLLGTRVNDRINGLGGNDVIVGGAGNDRLDGGSGDDLYVFNLGDGVDTIVDRASPGVGNAILFGPGISVSDITLELDNSGATPALIVHVGSSGDALRLEGLDLSDAAGPHAVETFRFADGTSLSYDQLLGLGIAVNGTSSAETLTGTSVRDRLAGAGGSDTLAGGEGDDIYFFNAGDGEVSINDASSPFDPNTIVFGNGITPDNLQLDLDAATGHLILRVGQSGDALRLSGFNPDDPYGAHAVEFYRFADGTVLTYSQLIDRGFDVLGTDANDDLLGTATTDRITGSAGHDLIRGGAGGDVAAGGAGDDTYIYRVGDGILTINDLATIGEGNTLEFGEGITLADMRNRLSYQPPAPGQTTGTFIIRIGEGTGDEVRLTNFNRDDADLGEHAVELFRFADGTTVNYRQLVQNTFIVQGDTGDDALRGTNLTDRLYGYEGSDTLRGNLGNDTLTGGSGNDELHGEDGDDTYVFNLGDGIDTIHEIATPAAPNRIVFGAGVALGDLSFEQTGNLLTIHYGSQGNAIQLPDFNFSNVGGTVVVSTLEFADGSTADLATLMNQSPVLDAPLADVAVRVEDVLSYAVPVGIFSDPDVGDTLTYSALLADGSALPSWLQFDASSGSFTGTPALGDLAVLDARVTATDALGLSANDRFTLSVVPRNRAPEVAQPLADQAVDEDAAVNLAIPADAFTDPDAGDTLAYSATLADGTALPAWLAFNADTRTFTGTPANGDVGALDIRVTATDGQGASVSDVFALTVNNVNDAPVLASAIADQSTTEGQAFSFTLNPATFSDDDAIHGDTLSFSATLADGAALPGWLSFDSATQTFSGTAPDDSTVTGTDGDDVMVSNDADVVHTIRVTATDTGGLSVSDDFALTVHDASPDDVYDGKGGNDRLDTGLGHDTLTGGTGNDTLLGGVGNDIYVYNVGDGLDALTDTDGLDTLRFGNDITAEQVVMRISAADGLARLRFLDADGCETTDQGIDITLNTDGSLPIESIVFADGSSLSPQELVIQSLTWYGTNQADVLTSGRHDDTIYGGNGKDVLTSGSGNDTLYGENGDDRLYGQGGHDTLTGGRGDDLLDGGCGDDTLVADQGEDILIGGQGSDTILLGQGEHTILFGVGDGQDVIKTLPSDDEEHDTEAEVVFGPGIDPNKLWFARNGDDLTVQLLGTQDRMTLEDWYTTSHKPIEEFQTTDGSELEARQVEQLVQAMAQFAPNLSADGSLPADQQQELNVVIAAAWERG